MVFCSLSYYKDLLTTTVLFPCNSSLYIVLKPVLMSFSDKIRRMTKNEHKILSRLKVWWYKTLRADTILRYIASFPNKQPHNSDLSMVSKYARISKNTIVGPWKAQWSPSCWRVKVWLIYPRSMQTQSTPRMLQKLKRKMTLIDSAQLDSDLYPNV